MRIWLTAILLASSTASCRPYPTLQEVDAELVQRAGEATAARAERLRRLLGRLSVPESKEQDQAMSRGFEAMVGYFRDTRDPALLDAWDGTRAEGGFANSLCESYRSLLSLPEVRQRYRDRGPDPLRRCVGLSLTRADLETVASEP